MIGRKVYVILAIMVLASLATAHEFWLEPNRFRFKEGETATFSFRVGENFVGGPWKSRKNRVTRLEHHSSSGVKDLRQSFEKDSVSEVELALTKAGSHVVVMESDPAFINLDGDSFTKYLEEDGLDEILWRRKKEGISGDSASELYSRHTKLILHCGNTSDELYRKTFNLPLEIIPEQDPAKLRKGHPISFKLLYNGKPLFGAKVKVWNRYRTTTSIQNIFTQQDGRIETHVSNPGVWMVSVVKMVPSQDPKVKYRSYWSTLVFGIAE